MSKYIEKVKIGVNQNKENPIDIYKNAISYICKGISMFSHPINIVNDLGFQYIVNNINNEFKIPSRKSITNKLISDTYYYKYKLKDIFKDLLSYGLSIDVWSFKSLSYISTVIRYIDGSKKLSVRTISIEEIPDQKAVTIRNYLDKITQFYNIDYQKIISITSDNCNSMLRSVHDFIDLFNNEEKYDIESLDMEEFSTDLSLLQNETNPEGTDQQLKISSSPYFIHIGCLLHLLQLSIKDAISQSDNFISTFGKIHFILKKLKANKYSKKISGVPTDNPTRWNYIFYQVEYFYNNFNKIKEIVNNDNFDISLLDNEKNIVEEYYIVLGTIEKLSKTLESKDCYIGDFYFRYKEIQHKINYIIENNLTKNKPVLCFLKHLKMSLETRIENKSPEFTTVLEISILFVPKRLKSNPLTIDRDMKRKIKELANNFKIETKPQTQTTGEITIKEVLMKGENSTTQLDSFELELSDYISTNWEHDNTLKFWENNSTNYPTLYKIFKVLLTIFPGNGDVERIFSRLKILSNWHRGRIKVGTLEARILGKEFYSNK